MIAPARRFRRGLVVGKFAPLHRGHMHVLAAAQAACDELFIMTYSNPELPGCPPAARARWLAELYPAARRLVVTDELLAPWRRRVPRNDAPDRVHRRFVGWLCRTLWRTTVDAVFTSEAYGDGFAAALTRDFHTHAAASAVTHVCVDQARTRVPISGTRLRADVHAGRAFLPPAIYASFVTRVCLIGGESSGKSTLAEALAHACGTTFVPEYGRARWEETRGALAFADLLAIARRQIADEEAAARAANRVLFCDTSPLVTWFYCQELFGRATPALTTLADRRYDLTVLCAPDFAFVQDGTRRDAAFRARQHAFYLERLTRTGAPFLLARGSLAARVAAVRAHLARAPEV